MRLKELLKKCRVTKVTPQTIMVTKDTMLQNKKALVVGGTGGIGFGIAKRLLESGADLLITGTNYERTKEKADALGVPFLVMDITDVSSIQQVISDAHSKMETIDILVVASGFHGADKFGSVSEETYDKVLDINMKGPFFVAQEMSKYMIPRKSGHILFVNSASCTKPAWEPYEISKWALRGFTTGLADTLIPHGIVVNGIAPGPVATKMIGKENTDDLSMPNNPSTRMATVEEIANLATFMVSPAGDMIVGDTYFISGGSGTTKMHN